MHNLKTYILKRIMIGKLNYEVWDENKKIKKFLYKSMNLIFKYLSLKSVKGILEREMTRYNSQKTDNVVAVGGSYGYWKETIPRTWLEELKIIEFENEHFYMPVRYHEYLEKLYGNFMDLPPERERYNRHGIIEINFGEDKK